MPQPEWIVDNLTALRAIDMSGANEFALKIHVLSSDADYMYDPNDTTSDNGLWAIEPNSGLGNGAWYPLDMITSTTTPSGNAVHRVSYGRIDPGSGGNDGIDRIYYNPGGNSTDWRFEILT